MSAAKIYPTGAVQLKADTSNAARAGEFPFAEQPGCGARLLVSVEWFPFPAVKPALADLDCWLCVATPSAEIPAQVAEWDGAQWRDTNDEAIAEAVTMWARLPSPPPATEEVAG